MKSMKPIHFSSTTKPWRVFVQASYFDDHKRRAKYFTTKDEAEYFCLRVRQRGLYATDFPRVNLIRPSTQYQPKVEPLFSNLDRRRLIPLAEVAKITGIKALRTHAINGSVPGARQIGKGKKQRWYFDRILLENWWQQFNHNSMQPN
jgi:hypothetical protein